MTRGSRDQEEEAPEEIEYVEAWCSWCFKYTEHHLEERNAFYRRDDFRCSRCEHPTHYCRSFRTCAAMARAAWEPEDAEDEGFWGSLWKNHEFCAEHDGTIAHFETLTLKLDQLQDFEKLFERRNVNVVRAGVIGAGMLGGVALAVPAAAAAAPTIASALGSAGVLGNAAGGAGVAIAGLKGAALQSASLAALGGGPLALGGAGMAGGVAVVAATGGALGGARSAAITNSYVGDIKNFDVAPIQDGRGRAVLFIDGFLTEGLEDRGKLWQQAAERRYGSKPQYHVQWESKSLRKIGNMVAGGFGMAAARRVVKGLAKRGSKKAGLGGGVFGLLHNPWHVALYRSAMVGAVLADLMKRTRHRAGFVLVGHSLGARVIFYALEALASDGGRSVVRDVHLLGAAVGRAPAASWREVSKAVSGNIFNCYSRNDMVLEYLYKAGTFFQSVPAGSNPLPRGSSCKNVDVSDIVGGHSEYLDSLEEILERCRKKARASSQSAKR